MNRINRFAFCLVPALVALLGNSDTLLAQQTFIVSSTSLTFNVQQNALPPAAQALQVTSSQGSGVTVVVNPSGTTWLQISKSVATTPDTINVSINSAGPSFALGTYTGSFTLTAAGHTAQTITVTMNVTATGGPNLTATPASLAFSMQTGGSAPPSQSLQIGSSGSQLSFTLATSTQSGGSWLQVNPAGGSTPGTIDVSINPAGVAVGTHNGTITVTSGGASNSPLLVPVTFTISALPNITASPGSLTFNHQIGTSANPAAQTVNIGSSGGPISFNIGIATNSGGSGWLVVSPASGVTPQGGTVALQVTVLPLTFALPVGTYTGAITVAAPVGTAGNTPLIIPITLNVSNNPLLTAAPTTLSFSHQVGTANPAAQTVNLTSTGSPIPYAASASSTGGWLQVTPASGITPSAITVTAVPGGLAPGSYTGTVTLTAGTAGNSPVNIPVTLTVSNNPLITASPTSLSFAYQTGQALPANQTVAIASTGSPFTYGATITTTPVGGTWLAVSPQGGTTPQNLAVSVSPVGLAAGTYSATISIAAQGAANSPVTVAVTLVVAGTPLLVVSPGSLSFSGAVGSTAIQSQNVAITSTDNSAQAFTVGGSTSSGGNWLLLGPGGSTPANVNVAVIPAGLPVGVYSASVQITAGGLANSPQTVGVTLNITSNATLSAAPASLAFTQNTGGAVPAGQSLTISSSSGVLSLTAAATTTSGGGWLTVNPVNASTPGTFTVSANGATLNPGVYNGQVTISSTGAANSPLTVPVTLTVTAAQQIQVTPSQLQFTHQSGATNPSPQTLQIALASGGTGNWTATTTTQQGTWLSVSPATGALPGSTSVVINPAGLTPGTYTGTVSVAVAGASNSPVSVPVTLTVTGPSLTVSPGSLPFSYSLGAPPPQAQVVAVSSSAPVSFTVSAAAAGGGTWLTATPSGTTTPATIGVSVNPTGLQIGNYTGTITVTAPGAGGSPQTVTVTLVVTAAVVSPVVTAVQNAASQLQVDLSAGQIISIYGTSIGPQTAVGTRLTPQGRVDTMIGDVRVLIDNIPCPLTYVQARQVNAVVPYEVSNRAFVTLQVEYLGVRSTALSLRVASASPGIFTIDGSGAGQGAILNQNGSVNSSANAAAKGSVIVIYATGEGQTSPPGVNGAVTGSAPPQPLQSVSVTIGGQPATVLYGGSAPGLVAGALQVNAVVPESVGSGPQTVVVRVGAAASQPGVTVMVQ